MIEPLDRSNSLFSEKYSLYSSMVFRICMIHLGNSNDVEDAMQESFIKFIYKSPVFSDSEHEKAWLIRVTTNVCKDMLRNSWNKRVDKREYLDRYYDSPSDIDIMEQVLALPPKYKIVIYLHYYEEYSIKRISQILKITESAVKMRLVRGRDILKIELEEEDL